jgi:hypothetical protein
MDLRVSYLTDIEGMWGKLASFAEDNPDVTLEGDALSVTPGSIFVFGGDAIDRGPDSRRVVAALLAAKERHPDRVVLLAGNRDINKMRLVRELTGAPPARTPESIKKDRPLLLRWIFESTMGARGAFDFRKEELEREGGAAVSDENVVDSFLADLSPGGALARYLAACQLAYRTGPTLFVHGGITEGSLSLVPRIPSPVGDLDEWIAKLNAFYRMQLDAYQAHALDLRSAGEYKDLIDYQAPFPGMRENPRSVIYSRNADALNNPELPTQAAIDKLARASIDRVVVGHTPNGDSPSVRRSGRFELHVADNSHSRLGVGSKFLIANDAVSVLGSTKLDDGRIARIGFRLARADLDNPVGKLTVDTGHLVKGVLESGELLLYKSLPGYRTEQPAITRAALEARGLRE